MLLSLQGLKLFIKQTQVLPLERQKKAETQFSLSCMKFSYGDEMRNVPDTNNSA
jgi:hypothetical protein